MHSISLRGLAAALSVLLASAVAAQTAAPKVPTPSAARPDPLDARAAVPPVLHRSALAGFRPALDVPVGSWKDANDTVTRIGGWRTYLREAAQPEAAAVPPPVTTPAPAAVPSAQPAPPARPAAGHHHHGKP